jgi:hypothetical protein
MYASCGIDHGHPFRWSLGLTRHLCQRATHCQAVRRASVPLGSGCALEVSRLTPVVLPSPSHIPPEPPASSAHGGGVVVDWGYLPGDDNPNSHIATTDTCAAAQWGAGALCQGAWGLRQRPPYPTMPLHTYPSPPAGAKGGGGDWGYDHRLPPPEGESEGEPPDPHATDDLHSGRLNTRQVTSLGSHGLRAFHTTPSGVV